MRYGARRITLLLGVLLALSGCQAPTAPSIVGLWGGSEVSLKLTRQGGQVIYQCGVGTIDPGWTLSSDGSFSATGEHRFGGGPIPVGGRPPHPATYTGRVVGDQMTLTVTVTDSDVTLGPFHLVRDGPAVTLMCV